MSARGVGLSGRSDRLGLRRRDGHNRAITTRDLPSQEPSGEGSPSQESLTQESSSQDPLDQAPPPQTGSAEVSSTTLTTTPPMNEASASTPADLALVSSSISPENSAQVAIQAQAQDLQGNVIVLNIRDRRQ